MAEEVGRALRRARSARGLTLRDAAALSGGTFKATAIAGYERGERSISLARFCDLALVYGIRPDRLLAETMRIRDGRSPTIIDIARLDDVAPKERSTVKDFVDGVQTLRGGPPIETIRLRVGDFDVLATACGRRTKKFTQVLRPALRREHSGSASGRRR